MNTLPTKYGSKGSITGFDAVDTSPSGTTESILKSNFSLADVMERIRRLEDITDPDTLYELARKLSLHIQNTTNPHEVTFEQTGVNVLGELYKAWLADGNVGTIDQYKNILLNRYVVANLGAIVTGSESNNLLTVAGAEVFLDAHNLDPQAHSVLFGDILPGTPPSRVPVYGFFAELEMIPFAGSVHRNSAICVINPAGTLVTVPPNTPAFDYSTGDAVLALWSRRSNLLISSDVTNTSDGQLLNSITILNQIGQHAPDRSNKFITLAESSSLATHGYTFVADLVAGTEYLESAFVLPQKSSNYIRMYLSDDPAVSIWVNTIDQSIVNQNGVTIGYGQKLPSGWYRIGMQHLPTHTRTSSVVVCLTDDTTVEAPVYQGSTTHILFSIFGIQHNAGHGFCPYIPSTGASGLLAPSYYTELIDVINKQVGMVSVKYTHYPSLIDHTNTILTIGNQNNIAIYDKHNTTTIEVKLADGTTIEVNQMTSPNTTVISAVSFDDNFIKTTITGMTKVVEPNAAHRTIADVSVLTLGSGTTSVDGGISEVMIYDCSDTGHALEFLKGENI